MKQKIIIDTDSGMDDIIAIAMIIASGKFDIEGVTTVRGLVNPTTGKKNLLKILWNLNYNAEVISGSKLPLNKKRNRYSFPTQDKINSSKLTCLNDLLVSVKIEKQTYPAYDYLFRKTNSSKGKITLLCLGPLTNIAKAIQKYGLEFTQNINQIVIMGGAVFTPGNVPPSKMAEYNIFMDPEAAEVVFSSKIPIKLVSLDATKFVPASNDLKAKIEKIDTKSNYGQLIQRLILANKNDFNYFYDPLAAGILIDPKIALQAKNISLKVSRNTINVGQTFATRESKNIKVITKVDSNRFTKLLLKSIK
jgi:purine nucleosidase